MGTTIYRDTVENSDFSDLTEIKTLRCMNALQLIQDIRKLIPLYSQKTVLKENNNYNSTVLVKVNSKTTVGIEKIDSLLLRLYQEIQNIDYDSIEKILLLSKETDGNKLRIFLKEYSTLSREKIMLQKELSTLINR
ncbi:MAG TPA: hypothetical protein PLZ05_01335 [Alphaproteobacteria bacterium]|nr:hypothetical protein [Alphaproteobacteria bacterium]